MILVTGATGFIGKSLVTKLLEQGHSVMVLSHKSPLESSWEGQLKSYQADITNLETLQRLPDTPVSAVIHLAAYIPPDDLPEQFSECFHINVQGTNNLLEFSRKRGIKKFINCSSAIVYGTSEKPSRFDESSPMSPRTYYAISKATGEMLVERNSMLSGMESASLRLAYVYGLGMFENFVFSRFLALAQRGEPITLYGDGSGIRDFIYVKDVVESIILALQKPVSGTYNIGSGTAISLAELASTIIRVTGSRSELVMHNKPGHDLSQPVLDIARAGHDFVFSPSYSLDDGLADLLKGEGTC